MKWRWAAFLAAGFLLLAACSAPAEQTGEGEGALIYYLVPAEDAQGNDRIQASRENLNLPETATVLEQVEAIVARLLEGPAEGNMTSPIPGNVELLNLELRDQTVKLDFSGEFRDLSRVDLVLADYCLTLSLTALERVQAVSITAEGRPLAQQPKQVFYERDVLLSDMGDVLQTVDVSLYFLNGDGNLEAERRMLSLYEGQTVAETLIAALLEGPENRELIPAIPSEFTVNYVRVDNKVCYVSLPASSLAVLPEDEQSQRMILWSLADSLYNSIDTLEEIRLLADGEELEFFGVVPVVDIAVRPQG